MQSYRESGSILGGLYPKISSVIPHRCGAAESIAQLVKGLEILRAFDLVLRQPAYHLPTGHFALGAFLRSEEHTSELQSP